MVSNRAEALTLPRPALLVIEPIEKYLDARGFGSGPLRWRRIGDGQSNITFLIERDGLVLVLRRGPRPPLPPSAHDMVREARIQQAAAAAGLPVAKILDICEDLDLLGVPFYLMEFVDGLVITDELPEQFHDPLEHRAISESAVLTLAQLHRADVSAGPLAQLGKSEGYLSRQVKRFSALWPGNTQRELPLFDRLSDWLAGHLPESSDAALVHGDYRIGNLLYAPHCPARVNCVLDWEMSTLGDPLADLGYFLATYSAPGEQATPLDLTPVTANPGFPNRSQLAKLYQAETGRSIDNLPWYQALALWKGAVFCEAIYSRWLRGERPEDTSFAPGLASGVPRLLEAARQTLELEL
ncbi:phosphotransferase family protein [Psychromicrobium lacuslunae]|uniref:phosphotransferase family protein n=1 Tax=Psychromicrobium lacuslunae TaxID=1618207 RepID=UPI000A98F4F6|nr:phosphotransferase family protein [Psychromicrobium lacuslunae]